MQDENFFERLALGFFDGLQALPFLEIDQRFEPLVEEGPDLCAAERVDLDALLRIASALRRSGRKGQLFDLFGQHGHAIENDLIGNSVMREMLAHGAINPMAGLIVIAK
jgi:hypothetical protein